MTIREKLIEILKVPIFPHEQADPAEVVADYLLDNGVTIQKWIPVTERLPKPGEFVLFHYAKNNRNPTMHAKNTMAVGRYEYKMFLVDGCSVKVTHWMPLPKGPEVSADA